MKEKIIYNKLKDLNLLKENYKLSYMKLFNINNEILLNDLLKLSIKYNFKIENEIINNTILRNEIKKLYKFIENY